LAIQPVISVTTHTAAIAPSGQRQIKRGLGLQSSLQPRFRRRHAPQMGHGGAGVENHITGHEDQSFRSLPR
jgi:hypothetical protein